MMNLYKLHSDPSSLFGFHDRGFYFMDELNQEILNQYKESGKKLVVKKSFGRLVPPTFDFPDNTHIEGDFEIGIDNKRIPKNLSVDGVLTINDNPNIKEIPPTIKFDSLIIQGCQNITELPFKQIKGSVALISSNIQKLYDGFSIGGTLQIKGGVMKELPNNMNVGLDLRLSGSYIEYIPEDATIGGTLQAEGSSLKTVPLISGKELYLHQADNIEYLPNGLDLEELVVSSPKLTKLPDDLKVSRKLSIRGTNIKELPKGITELDELNISNTMVEDISHMTTIGYLMIGENTRVLNPNLITKSIDMAGNKQIKKFPDGLQVVDLSLRNSVLEELPVINDEILKNYPGYDSGMVLDGDNSSIKKIPSGSKFKELRMSESNLREIGDNVSVEGTCDLRDSNLSKIGNNFRVGRTNYGNGDCDMSGTNIRSIPSSTRIGGYLMLYYTPISENENDIPDGIAKDVLY